MSLRFKPQLRLAIFPALLAIAVLLWSQSLYVVWDVVRAVHYAEQQEKKSIKDTVLVHAGLSINWVEEHEANINGHMFDVVQRKRTIDGLLLIGHWDEEDDELMRWLANVFGNRSDPHKSQSSFWFFDAIVAQAYVWQARVSGSYNTARQPLYATPLVWWANPFDTPPPRVV